MYEPDGDSRLETEKCVQIIYLRTMSRCLILPVPVVFLLLAFTDLKISLLASSIKVLTHFS